MTGWRGLWNRLRGAAAALLLSALASPSAAAPPDPATLLVKDTANRPIIEYKASYALVISVSSYRDGWRKLIHTGEEARQLAAALTAQDFAVTIIPDASADQMRAGINNFFGAYGYNKDNRLLLFFTGHGYSRNHIGYLVPNDAPDPQKNPGGFFSKAMSMLDIQAIARRIEANHVLFVFDSCFSGSIFETKSIPKIDNPALTKIASGPVRQFITAGGADEEVPSKSEFTPQFIEMIRGGADLNGDGYITGTELGYTLQDKVSKMAPHTPNYGKILDASLNKGEFIFQYRKDDDLSISPPTKDDVTYEYLAFFDFASTKLTPASTIVVDDMIKKFKADNFKSITVVGHNDTSLEEMAAHELSLERAKSVALYLAKRGVPVNAVSIKALGYSAPLVPTGKNVREPANRRVQMILGK